MQGDSWNAIEETASRLLLGAAKPNTTLVGEALSFDAGELHTLTDFDLRRYIVVLGQYLITLQFEENKLEAIYLAWQRSLDSYMHRAMGEAEISNSKRGTLTERRAWILANDEQAKQLNDELSVAEARKTVVKSMFRPMEQYINTLKKEVDARENDRKRGAIHG